MNPPRHKLMTPMKVIIKETCDGCERPTIIPIAPTPKNINSRTLSFFGGTYLIDVAQVNGY